MRLQGEKHWVHGLRLGRRLLHVFKWVHHNKLSVLPKQKELRILLLFQQRLFERVLQGASLKSRNTCVCLGSHAPPPLRPMHVLFVRACP